MDDLDLRLFDERIAELEQQRDAAAAAFQTRIDRLKAFRSELTKDREFRQDLGAIFATESGESELNGANDREGQAAPTSAALAAIRDCFRTQGNRWMTAKEVGEVTGLRDTTVRQVAYARYPKLFEKRKMPEDPRKAQLRLVEG